MLAAHHNPCSECEQCSMLVLITHSLTTGLQITDELVRSGAVELVVVDSVAALVPRAELEGEMGMLQVGLQARLMSQGLRKLTGNASRSSATIIFLNQIRHKVGAGAGHALLARPIVSGILAL